MFLRLDTVQEKKLIGFSAEMTFASHSPEPLWKQLMPRRKEITTIVGQELYSLEVYPKGFFESFSLEDPFTKWAAVEVSQDENIPEGFEKLLIPTGLYAVFQHKGPSSGAKRTYDYIFMEWLPKSGFDLDDRPHYAVMGEGYKHNDPDSVEEIFIPIGRNGMVGTT